MAKVTLIALPYDSGRPNERMGRYDPSKWGEPVLRARNHKITGVKNVMADVAV